MKIINITQSVKTVNCNGRTLTFGGTPKIMGIINLTPDSFSDGGDLISPELALKSALKMERDGADLLDIGAESSRPGHQIISVEEEITRLLPGLQLILSQTTIPISVDTWKHQVAQAALEQGANLINDIYGLKKDPQLAAVIASYGAGVILMHNQKHNEYPLEMTGMIINSLKESIELALSAGIESNKIILDPGIGFGKNPEQNLELMGQLYKLHELGYPLLLGASRKSLIGSVINVPPKERLPGTIASTVLGILQGYEFFRVHDVAENRQAALFSEAIIRRIHG